MMNSWIYCFKQIQMFLKTISSFHTLLVSFMTDIKKEEEEFTLQTQDEKSHRLLDFLQESFTGFSTKEFVNFISKRCQID